MTLNIILRASTIALFTLLRVYWSMTKLTADKEKPKTKHQPIRMELFVIVMWSAVILSGLFGFAVWRFDSFFLQTLGFILVTLGFAESMLGRKTLTTNWTESYDYQIKKNHELITSGIYKYVCHPIYGGMFLMNLGALMVAQTWLFVPAVLVIVPLTSAAKREEKILSKHFGKKYIHYITKTQRFFPFVY